jgi:hypothetical protein
MNSQERFRRVIVFGFLCVTAVSLPTLTAQSGGPQRGTAPSVTVLKAPDFWGEFAIWGSTGSDRGGHIFFGMTSNDDRGDGSAHLFELNPATSAFTDKGDVVSELKRLNLRRPGETQMKIHSRIVVGADGLQYFASMDETGEKEDGSRLPTWGGHLWRRSASGAWEHLAATPQALIGVASGGPYIYALGYFNHVVFQFDTRNKRVRSAAVGAAGGHVSRNFFADNRGHVFVPRTAGQGKAVQASLVELDADLHEVGSLPMPAYFPPGADDSHGIVAIVPDDDNGWYFATATGRLYHERPGAPLFTLEDLGWMHPAGSRYTPSLFRAAGSGTLYAIAAPSYEGSRRYDWVARRADGRTTVATLPYGNVQDFSGGANLYGSMTQDADGRFYVVGTMSYKPVILQIRPAAENMN